MPYTAHKPQRADIDELRARIPGWGVDLDPRDRPSVPKERFDPEATGAHWEFPERQPEHRPRERSIEHRFLTPVFGTSAPLRGFSGAIRRYAYRFSEGRAAHWLILLGADRVDAWEGHLTSLMSGHPDNPLTETGMRSEAPPPGPFSRRDGRRADTNHQWLDPLVVGGPGLLAAGAGVAIVCARAFRRRGRALKATRRRGPNH